MQNNIEKLNPPHGIELYEWQKNFINTSNKDKVLLCAEAGCGKTFAAICWLQLRPKIKALVIAPKGIQSKWKADLKLWGVKNDYTTLGGEYSK
jgi:ERCC4-related helicase